MNDSGPDSIVIRFFGAVIDLLSFVRTMEKQLEDAKSESLEGLRTRVRSLRAGELSPEELKTAQRIHRNHYLEVFPKALRYSFTALLYNNLVELYLKELCDKVRTERNLSLKIGDLQGGSVQRGKLYLTKVANLPDVSADLWEPVEFVGKVRNCIVHAAGDVRRSNYESRLRDQSGQKPGYSVQQNEIALGKGFCEFALKSCDDLLTELFKAAGLNLGTYLPIMYDLR